MQLKQLLNDDDAVSPVIGVILMVAITVILAAVIGTFVLGLGDQVQTTAPSHNFATDQGEGTVTFSSNGGQSVEAGNLAFQHDIEGLVYVEGGTYPEADDGVTWATADNADSDSVSAGDSVEFQSESGEEPTGWSGDESITLVWEDQGQSSTMTTWEAS